MPASTHPTDRLHVGAEEITFRVTSDQSKGKLVALETLIPAGGGPPMLHRHASFEAYRVDGGELAFYVEDEGGIVQRSVRREGAMVAIPAGREHTIRNESDAPARAFVVFAPGGEMERFARAAHRLGADGSSAPAEIVALAEAHGMEITRPVKGLA